MGKGVTEKITNCTLKEMSNLNEKLLDDCEYKNSKSINLVLIIRKYEISLFIKPSQEELTDPVLLMNNQLKTTENLIGKKIVLGSANENYRSALLKWGNIKIFPCPKNIEEELKCVIC